MLAPWSYCLPDCDGILSPPLGRKMQLRRQTARCRFDAVVVQAARPDEFHIRLGGPQKADRQTCGLVRHFNLILQFVGRAHPRIGGYPTLLLKKNVALCLCRLAVARPSPTPDKSPSLSPTAHPRLIDRSTQGGRSVQGCDLAATQVGSRQPRSGSDTPSSPRP